MDEQLKLLKKINRRTRFTQFLAWLALFFTAVGIAAGYKNWLRIHDKAKLALRQIEEVNQQLPNFALEEKLARLEAEINLNFKDNKEHLDKAMTELRTIQDSTQHIADTVYSQAENLAQQQTQANLNALPQAMDWSLAEVRFLLQTAVQQFTLKKDPKSAIEAFKLADRLLLEQGDLDYLPIRKRISEDMAAVKQYQKVDVDILSAQIDDLLERLKPEFKSQPVTSQTIELLPVEKNQGDKPTTKDSLVTKVKKTINGAIVIKKLEQPLQKDLDAEAKERLYQLFALRLETLRIMLLQGDDKNYHKQLKRIQSLLARYYSDEQNQQYLTHLKQLSEVNLSPTLPKIDSALLLLKQLSADSPALIDSSKSEP